MNQPIANTPVVYHLRPLDTGAHLYEVTCRVERPAPDGQLLSLPAWIPGSYLVRDYARHVVKLEAKSGGDAVALQACLQKASGTCTKALGKITASPPAVST